MMKPVMYLFQRCQATECPEEAYPNKWPTTAHKNINAECPEGAYPNKWPTTANKNVSASF